MIDEQTIRAIAQRHMEPIRNANSADERRLILENAIREALMMAARRCPPLEINGGCL